MAEEGQVISCHTIEAWTEQLDKALQSKKLIVVDFTASWCPPCRLMAPIFAECAKIFTNVIFVKIDVDELKSVAEDWAVEAMPTFVFFKEGKILEKVVGAQQKEKFHQIVQTHATATATA